MSNWFPSSWISLSSWFDYFGGLNETNDSSSDINDSPKNKRHCIRKDIISPTMLDKKFLLRSHDSLVIISDLIPSECDADSFKPNNLVNLNHSDQFNSSIILNKDDLILSQFYVNHPLIIFEASLQSFMGTLRKYFLYPLSELFILSHFYCEAPSIENLVTFLHSHNNDSPINAPFTIEITKQQYKHNNETNTDRVYKQDAIVCIYQKNDKHGDNEKGELIYSSFIEGTCVPQSEYQFLRSSAQFGYESKSTLNSIVSTFLKKELVNSPLDSLVFVSDDFHYINDNNTNEALFHYRASCVSNIDTLFFGGYDGIVNVDHVPGVQLFYMAYQICIAVLNTINSDNCSNTYLISFDARFVSFADLDENLLTDCWLMKKEKQESLPYHQYDFKVEMKQYNKVRSKFQLSILTKI